MTQKLREQISALCDHELPEGEHELLLRRFAVEKSLRLHWERYHLIGSAMRKELPAVDTRGFADRVMGALTEQEPVPAAAPVRWTGRLLRGAASVAIAASVAVVAIIGLNHGAVRHGTAPGEIVPNSVAGGETAPVDLVNSANWTGEQVPVQASLDSALVDQEGSADSLGKHGLKAHRYPAPPGQADQTKKDADAPKPPRQD